MLSLAAYYGEDDYYGNNYLLANGAYWYNFVENEVSMYFNPKSTNSDLNKLATRQSEDFRDAILGFFVVGTTCTGHHRELDGSPSTFNVWTDNSQYNAYTVGNADTRCNLFFNFVGWDKPFQSDESVNKQVNNADRTKAEPPLIKKACSYVVEISKRFNQKYRSGTNDKQVGTFVYTGKGSTYVSYEDLQALNSGSGEIDPNRYFMAMGDCSKLPLERTQLP